MNRLRLWWRRADVRFYGTVAVFTAIVLVYAAILCFGHRPSPPPDLRLPLFWRLHPERLLAMVAGVLGMFATIRHLREERPLLGPLCWILFAGLVHLASVAMDLDWF